MVTANVQRLTVSWPDARVCFYRGEVVLPGPVSRIEAKTLMYSSCAWVRGGVMVAASVQRLAITPLNHKQWVCPPRSHANKSPLRPAVAKLLMAVTKNCAMANTPRLQVETHQDVLETSASRPAGTSLLARFSSFSAWPTPKPSQADARALMRGHIAGTTVNTTLSCTSQLVTLRVHSSLCLLLYSANVLANMKDSEEFDDDDEDQDSEEVDNNMHAAAEGDVEYRGIHEGAQDDVIEALLALSDS